MALIAKPKFLQVPPLYEESTATVSWENVEEAGRYKLDIVYNEDFDTASQGKRRLAEQPAPVSAPAGKALPHVCFPIIPILYLIITFPPYRYNPQSIRA